MPKNPPPRVFGWGSTASGALLHSRPHLGDEFVERGVKSSQTPPRSNTELICYWKKKWKHFEKTNSNDVYCINSFTITSIYKTQNWSPGLPKCTCDITAVVSRPLAYLSNSPNVSLTKIILRLGKQEAWIRSKVKVKVAFKLKVFALMPYQKTKPHQLHTGDHSTSLLSP